MSESSPKEAGEAFGTRAFGTRVYEYRDDDGTVYYSFTQGQNLISPPKRLKMTNRQGEHLIGFLGRLRRVGDSLRLLGKEDG